MSDRVEVRWFVRGDVTRVLRPHGRACRRVDLYEWSSLRSDSATKRRGRGGSLERKSRIGEPAAVAPAGISGQMERWTKCRLPGVTDLEGPWVPVTK